MDMSERENAFSKTRFTPGPWVAYPNPMRDDGWFVSTEARKPTGSKSITDDGRIAPYMVPEKNITYFQISGEANARLIAAAPDLYVSLKHAVEIIEKHVPRDALGTNAQGDPSVPHGYEEWPLLDEYLHHMRAALSKAGCQS